MPSSPMTTSCCRPVASQIGCVVNSTANFVAKPGSTTYWLPRSLPRNNMQLPQARTTGVIGQELIRINDLIALSWSSEFWSRLLSGRLNANFEQRVWESYDDRHCRKGQRGHRLTPR